MAGYGRVVDVLPVFRVACLSMITDSYYDKDYFFSLRHNKMRMKNRETCHAF